MLKCVSICKFESLSQISRWYSEIIKYNCCSSYGTNYFCNLLAPRAGEVCTVHEFCNYSFIGVQQKTMQKCVSICKFESLSQISRWYSEIIKSNYCSRYGTNYFCNLLARAGCAQCASFAIIHSLGFIGRKLCRNAVPAQQGAMVKHNEAIRGHKMLRAFIHPRQYSFLPARAALPSGPGPGLTEPGGQGGKGSPSIF